MDSPRHVFIAGGGGIGRAVALLLLHEPSFPCRVTIGDQSLESARAAAEFAAAGGGPVEGLAMPPGESTRELAAVLERADAILDCLPGSEAPRLARLALRHRCHYLNLTEYVRETEQVLGLAAGAPTAFALQCGLAPGVIDVLGVYLVREARRRFGCERLECLRLRVGALPRSVRAPHYYGWTWSTVGVATEYVRPSIAVRDHRIVSLPSLSERATLIVEGLTLEEDLTSGGAADLPQALARDVRDLDYKTLRYPGHYAWVEGLLRDVPDDGARPAALQAAMEARIPTCEDDQVVIYADVEGRDRSGALRSLKVARVVGGLELAGRRLRAIQSTTAAGLAEVLRLVFLEGRRGPLLQSQLPAEALLAGPFVRLAYGDLTLG